MPRRRSNYWECKQCGYRFETESIKEYWKNVDYYNKCPECKGVLIKERSLKKVKEKKYPENKPMSIKEIKYTKMERDLNSLEKAQMLNEEINLEKEDDREREKLREKLQ